MADIASALFGQPLVERLLDARNVVDAAAGRFYVGVELLETDEVLEVGMHFVIGARDGG